MLVRGLPVSGGLRRRAQRLQTRVTHPTDRLYSMQRKRPREWRL